MLHIFVRRIYPDGDETFLGVTYCADKFHQTYVTRTIKSLKDNNAIRINF